MSCLKIANFRGGTKEKLTLVQFVLTFSEVRLGLKKAKEMVDELVEGKEIQLEIAEDKRAEISNQLASLKVDFW